MKDKTIDSRLDNLRGSGLPIVGMSIIKPQGEDYEGCNASFPSVTMEQQQQLLMFYHPEPQVPSEAGVLASYRWKARQPKDHFWRSAYFF